MNKYMRYLSNRNDFLKINEEITAGTGGPFHNDLGWSDSLLGRLINHTIRKAKVAVNITKIKPLVRQLRSEFENILLQSQFESISDESKMVAAEMKLSLFFKKLIESIDNNDEVPKIISIIDDSIENVKSENFSNGDILIDELEKFKAFLQEKDNNDELESDNESSTNNLYKYMIKNLSSLNLIIQNINRVSSDKVLGIGDECLYKGNIVKIVSVDTTLKPGPDETWLTKDDQKGEKIAPNYFIVWRDVETKKYLPNAKTQSVKKSDLKVLNESLKFDNNRNKIDSNNTNAGESFNKLKSSINILISSKEKGIGVDSKLITDILNKSKSIEGKEAIKSLYKEILRYLIGDKKATLGNMNSLYKESIELISDKNKKIIIAEKLARFIKRAIQFDGENLYGSLGDIGKPLQNFVESIKYIMSNSKSQISNESILKYDRFLSINENKDINEIRSYFDENCKEVKNFKVESSDIDKANSEMSESKVDENNIKFETDSVIKIIKLFNRAYKLYTVNTITKRSENVDTNTLGEYTSFGSGGETGRSGPYRNNKIFQIWEDGVYEILGDRKFQAIFTKNAKLMIPKVTNPDMSNPKDWIIKDNAGQNLRTFMNKMLDGDQIYKSGDGKGQIYTMIEKYFGSETSDVSEKALKNDIDTKENIKMADKIDELSTKLKFLKISAEPSNRSIFLLDCSINGEDNKQRSCFIDSIENGIVYIVICVSFNRIEKLLYATKDTKFNTSRGDFDRDLATGDFKFIYSKMKKDDFVKYMKAGSTVSITSATNSGSNSIKTDEVKIVNIFWLTKNGEKYFIPKDDKDNLPKIFKGISEREYPSKWIKSLPESIKIINK